MAKIFSPTVSPVSQRRKSRKLTTKIKWPPIRPTAESNLVTGVVSTIDSGLANSRYIVFRGTNEFEGPQASLAEASSH